MADTGITVALIAVMIQIIYAAKLTHVDSHPLAGKEANENPLKRMTDPYANSRGGDDCNNYEIQCRGWAATGECDRNPMYMHRTCQHACGTCACSDNNEQCETWAGIGECSFNPGYMISHCRLSCGRCTRSGSNGRRDVTRNFGNSPPGTRDDSRRQVRKVGHNGPPDTRETGSI
ncbi:putative tyrosinase-like protein tyr-3 [Mizuhopecten yessoensis]|uniref:putative tyrosinase-like protein tyr-3 n=1 Tax=Mizuhopecten yessoensis TaxID=6573 RepID=UPI000B45D503|nr:putative tyrosinase-like protein tyr-3 [Mizuhopecten yessoensis]